MTTTDIAETVGTETTGQLLTLEADAFRNGLSNAILFTAGDVYLPVLDAINIRFNAATKTMTMQATDRYRLITVKVADDIITDAEDFEFLLSAEDAKALIAKIRYPKKLTDSEIQLEIFDDHLEMIYYQKIEMVERAMRVEGEYPKIAPIFEVKESEVTGGPKLFASLETFNPVFIESVAKIRDYRGKATGHRTEITMAHRAENGMLQFWAGDFAVGLVMPIKNRDPQELTVPSWATA